MIGIGRHRLGDLPRRIPGQSMFIKEHAHTFRHGQSWVRIIQMDRHLRRKSVKRGMRFEIASKDIADGAGHQEVFLHQTEFTAAARASEGYSTLEMISEAIFCSHSPEIITLIEDLQIKFISRTARRGRSRAGSGRRAAAGHAGPPSPELLAPASRDGFGWRARSGSQVERVDMSIYDATPEELGTFDLVFCGSVVIHLRDQLGALERIAALCTAPS